MMEEENKSTFFEEELVSFLKRNPYSGIERKGNSYYVVNPWNTKAVSFLLEEETQDHLIAALNNLVLPPRFTALYHLDTNTMEYIFAPLPMNSPYLSRQFEFRIEGESYHCRFADASDRLVLISRLFRPGEEPGDDRNLMLLHMYMSQDLAQPTELEPDFFADMKPVSFFVGEFEGFDEEKIVEVSKHINFFLQYYDRKSTYTIIHPIESGEPEAIKQLRFVEESFPKNISSRRKDPFLLDLALTANEADTRLAFLYYYQILEYAAFYYVDTDIKRKMLQIVATPDIHANPDKYMARILDTVTDIRQTDEAKLNKVVEAGCSPDIVWKELQQNLPYFSKKQEFDGGFILEPFICENMTLESFSAMWIPKTPDTLRRIRNALVHSRETRLGLIIAPTLDNDLKIRPWLPVIRRIAEQIIIFREFT